MIGFRENVESQIDELVEHGRAISKLVEPGDGEWRLRTLLKVYDWAVKQQPFAVGDRVLVVDGPFKKGHGYEPYNDTWSTRPGGVVESVEYNGAHRYWAFAIRLDAWPTKLFGFGASSLRSANPPERADD